MDANGKGNFQAFWAGFGPGPGGLIEAILVAVARRNFFPKADTLLINRPPYSSLTDIRMGYGRRHLGLAAVTLWGARRSLSGAATTKHNY